MQTNGQKVRPYKYSGFFLQRHGSLKIRLYCISLTCQGIPPKMSSRPQSTQNQQYSGSTFPIQSTSIELRGFTCSFAHANGMHIQRPSTKKTFINTLYIHYITNKKGRKKKGNLSACLRTSRYAEQSSGMPTCTQGCHHKRFPVLTLCAEGVPKVDLAFEGIPRRPQASENLRGMCKCILTVFNCHTVPTVCTAPKDMYFIPLIQRSLEVDCFGTTKNTHYF